MVILQTWEDVLILKSHDCHVLDVTLFCFNSLPMYMLNPLIEISHLFKDLCSTTLIRDSLRKRAENISLIIYKLERIFLSQFFDSMEHLLIHLSYETWLGGLVRYRWMYPFEM